MARQSFSSRKDNGIEFSRYPAPRALRLPASLEDVFTALRNRLNISAASLLELALSEFSALERRERIEILSEDSIMLKDPVRPKLLVVANVRPSESIQMMTKNTIAECYQEGTDYSEAQIWRQACVYRLTRAGE